MHGGALFSLCSSSVPQLPAKRTSSVRMRRNSSFLKLLAVILESFGAVRRAGKQVRLVQRDVPFSINVTQESGIAFSCVTVTGERNDRLSLAAGTVIHIVRLLSSPDPVSQQYIQHLPIVTRIGSQLVRTCLNVPLLGQGSCKFFTILDARN